MDADLKAKLAENGMEVATSTPDELKRLITQDIKVHAELVRPAGGEICCLMRSFLRHSVASRTCMIAFHPCQGLPCHRFRDPRTLCGELTAANTKLSSTSWATHHACFYFL